MSDAPKESVKDTQNLYSIKVTKSSIRKMYFEPLSSPVTYTRNVY